MGVTWRNVLEVVRSETMRVEGGHIAAKRLVKHFRAEGMNVVAPDEQAHACKMAVFDTLARMVEAVIDDAPLRERLAQRMRRGPALDRAVEKY